MKVKHPFRRIKQSFLDLQIRKKLLISFAALIVLPVTLMAVFYLTNSKIILEQKSSVYTSNVLSELKTNLENTVSELDGVFMQLANDPNIQQSIAFLRSDNSTPEERQQGVELANDALRDQLYSHSGLISSLSRRSRFPTPVQSRLFPMKTHSNKSLTIPAKESGFVKKAIQSPMYG